MGFLRDGLERGGGIGEYPLLEGGIWTSVKVLRVSGLPPGYLPERVCIVVILLFPAQCQCGNHILSQTDYEG